MLWMLNLRFTFRSTKTCGVSSLYNRGMSENLRESVEAELGRIADLDLNEQPEAFSALRDQLEAALESPESVE